jgi:hypothetical protein
LVLKIDSLGQLNWFRGDENWYVRQSVINHNNGFSLAGVLYDTVRVDNGNPNNDIVATRHFMTTMDADPDTGTFQFNSNGFQDFYSIT